MPMNLFNRRARAQRERAKAKAATVAPMLAVNDLGNGEAEIIMYGDVVENEPIDWWTGEPTGELVISAQSFLAELDSIRNASHIDIRLNSGGGDVFTGVAIHNALRSLPATKTVHIDGLAASAASVIACAGDEVVVHPGSWMMIHEGYVGLFGWYTPDDLAKMQNECAAITQSMVNIYMAKSGREEEEIRELVHAETWFTGQEIIDAGFADRFSEEVEEEDDDGEVDEVVYDAAAHLLTIGGIRHDASMFRNMPTAEAMAKRLHAARSAHAAIAIDQEEPPQAAKTKGETHMKDVAELRASHPELVAEVERHAAEAERERIKGIEEIAGSIKPELVAKAKFEEPCTAADLALASVKAGGVAGETFLAQVEEDDEDSGAEEVESDPKGDERVDEDAEAKAAIDAASAVVNASLNRKAR